MADEQSTTGSAFDKLAAAMPQIAEAIKDLPEGVQGKAFDALVATFSNGAVAADDGAKSRGRGPRKTATGKSRAAAEAGSGRRKATPITITKGLDLAPKGKKSLKDFVAEKNPTTVQDRNVVAVYWLSQIAGHAPITAGDVYTCYRGESWKIPANFSNALAVTANKKGFFDTSNMSDIKLVSHGINRVEHDLPKRAKP